MDDIEDIVNYDLALVNRELNKHLRHDNLVDEEIDNFINGPSKHVRSIIVLLYLYANDKKADTSIIDLLAGCELIHSASLLHDDVVDEADKRRENTTLARKISPYISILAGDYLVSLAVKKIMNLNNPDILQKFTVCIEKMSRAEIRQYLQRNEKISADSYLDICRDKTAGLFGTVLECAALLSGLDTDKAKNLGMIYGTLFQIKNDMEPYSADNDRKNGVSTAAEIFGIEKTTNLADNYKKEMREIIINFPNERYRNALVRFTDNL